MKLLYHDETRQCSIIGGHEVSDLDSIAAKYLCPYCHGGITVQKVGEVWRLHCPRCGPLHAVASKYAGGRSSHIFPVREAAKKSELDLFGGEQMRYSGYPTTFDKTKPLKTSPHYSDKRFEQEQTVFGKPSRYGHKHLSYDYSDRLFQWDYDKAEQSAKCATESGAALNSCRWYEAYLSAYFDRTVVIDHIIAGVNRSNGFPYCVFGYRDKEATHVG